MAVANLFGEPLEPMRDAIQHLDEHLEKQHGIDTRVLSPSHDDPKHHDSLDQAIVNFEIVCSRVAYQLGVAVGMRLGSAAFGAIEPERRR